MDLFSSTDQWIEAFGKTLIHSLWSGLILLFLLQVVLHAISHKRSQLRYLLAGLTMILYLGSVLALFAILYRPSAEGTGTFPGSAGLANTVRWLAINPTDTPLALDSLWSLCCYLYAAGTVFMILRFGYAVFHLQRIKSSGTTVNEQWIDLFIQLTGRMKISQEVRLLESDRITVPGLVGWIRPAVIVPAGMLTHLPLNQVETILMHELYHLKRYDFLVNAFQMVMEGLFFYNPAVWMISKTMRLEREHCCDDLVIANCTAPLLYAKALFQISNRSYSVKRWVPAAGGPDHPGLFNRISRILNYQTMKTDIRDKLFSLLIFFAGVAIFLAINGFSSGVSVLKTIAGEPSFSTGPAGNGPVIQTLAEPQPEATPEVMDTIPVAPEPNSGDVQKDVLSDQEIDEMIEEAKKAQKEAMEDIDWDEIKEEMEKAKTEALEDIDWETLKREMEQAKTEALEDIDWDEIKEEIEKAKTEALEDIDWDEIKEEIERAKVEALEEIDWESVKKEIEESMKELKEIDWEQMRKDVEKSMNEIDWQNMRIEIEESIKDIDFESIKKDIENSVNEIDWDELRQNLEQMRTEIEIMMQGMARDPADS